MANMHCSGFEESDHGTQPDTMSPLSAMSMPPLPTRSMLPFLHSPIQTTKRPKVNHGGWEDRFAQLEVYCTKMGHANPPQTKGSPEGDYRLAIWLNGQRQKFRKGSLDEEKLHRLQQLGCEGFHQIDNVKLAPPPVPGKRSNKRPKKVTWYERYEELKRFKARFGHAAPHYGKSTPDSCQHLAQWLSNQRSDFRLGKKITGSQAQMLRELGAKGFGGDEEGEYGDESLLISTRSEERCLFSEPIINSQECRDGKG